MNFAALTERHTKWRDILVIGKTVERKEGNCHILGMTLADEAKLYIIEPWTEPQRSVRKGARTHRRQLKEHTEHICRYLHCSRFAFGSAEYKVQGGSGGPLIYSSEDYGTIQLFLDMMSAGWTVPEWLKNANWAQLQLITLTLENAEKLPAYLPGMPITVTHRPDSTRHLLEKSVTLRTGKSRSFSFTDTCGDTVWCHINNVSLIDVWKDTEQEFQNPKLTEKFTPEQLDLARKHSRLTLEQCCPKGMCYIGVEYECSKDYQLVFYSKEYLKSKPQSRQGSAHFLMMNLKPDRELGTHSLPLKGFVIDTPVPPDTVQIPAEGFLYYEKTGEWTEIL